MASCVPEVPDFRADVDLGNSGEEVTRWLIQTEVGTTGVPAGISPALGQVCAQCLSLGQVTNPHPVRLPPTSLSLSAFLEAASRWGRTCSASGLFGVWSQEAGGEGEREGVVRRPVRVPEGAGHRMCTWPSAGTRGLLRGPCLGHPPPRGHMEWRGASRTSAPAPLPACRVQEEARRGQGSCHGWPAGATLARENTQQRRGGCEGGAPEQPAPPTPSGRLSGRVWGRPRSWLLQEASPFSHAPPCSSLPGPEERVF